MSFLYTILRSQEAVFYEILLSNFAFLNQFPKCDASGINDVSCMQPFCLGNTMPLKLVIAPALIKIIIQI